jgi:glucose-1-phosphate thymidylyltransferase
MKAYLLAAGYATRLHPLTRDRPKPLLDIGGRPLLSHILDRVLQIGDLSGVVIIGNHRFQGPLAAWASGAPSPVPIEVLDDGSTSDDDKLGASGDLAFALRESPPAPDEDFVVIAGDNWIRFDLHAARDDYEEQGRRPMILVRQLEAVPDGPSPYNEVTTDAEGRVLRLREKPDDPRTPYVAIAAYFFPPGVRDLLACYLDRGGNPDAPGHFIEWLVQHAPVRSHIFTGEWMDIGSPEALEQARARAAQLHAQCDD